MKVQMISVIGEMAEQRAALSCALDFAQGPDELLSRRIDFLVTGGFATPASRQDGFRDTLDF